MSKELKPCPFCGGDASLIVKTFFGLPEEDVYTVACNDCKSQSCYSDDRKETVKVWNTRPAEDAKDREIERLKNKLKELKECIIDSRDKYMRLTEHKDFTTATISFGAYNLLNSFIEIINAPDTNVGTKGDGE